MCLYFDLRDLIIYIRNIGPYRKLYPTKGKRERVIYHGHGLGTRRQPIHLSVWIIQHAMIWNCLIWIIRTLGHYFYHLWLTRVAQGLKWGPFRPPDSSLSQHFPPGPRAFRWICQKSNPRLYGCKACICPQNYSPLPSPCQGMSHEEVWHYVHVWAMK